ncbi:MAG TPA: sugar ABC transporter substrate-binding protein [Chthonomonadaceae bacterium]|nr:sugar ABC transporter substrate-binding protein [Chthonomonadaceae bacterium]
MFRKIAFATGWAMLALLAFGCGPSEPNNGAPPSSGGPANTSAGTSAGTSSSGSTSSAAGGSGALIGVSLSSRNHNFFLGMEQGVQDELKAEGLQSETVVAENDASTQQQQVDTLIRKGVKAIIMVPVDAEQAATPIAAANKANIPVFCIDRRIKSADARVTATIETDNVGMGEDAAKYALKLLCDRRKLDSTKPDDVKKLKTTVVHLWGLEAASSAQDRAQGFEKVFNPANTPGVNVLKAVGEFNAKKAQEVMGPLLRAHPEVELVYCHNDDNAIGALNAIIDIKKQREAPTDPKRILIVSIDGNKPAIEAIRKGDIEATVAQEPIQMGSECVKQVKKVVDGGKPDKDYIAIPHSLITKKEADEKKGQLWADQLRAAK